MSLKQISSREASYQCPCDEYKDTIEEERKSEAMKVYDDAEYKQAVKLHYEIQPYSGSQSYSKQHSFKMIFIGNSAVGKSCLRYRISKGEFTDEGVVTVGAELEQLNVKVEDIMINLQLWDTGGQETYESLTQIYYRNANLALLTYSIANKDSFNRLPVWLEKVRSLVQPETLIFLVGNQKDRELERQVSYKKAEKFKRDNRIDFMIETSAKTGENVKELFGTAARMLYIRQQTRPMRDTLNKQRGRTLKKDTSQDDCTCAC